MLSQRSSLLDLEVSNLMKKSRTLFAAALMIGMIAVPLAASAVELGASLVSKTAEQAGYSAANDTTASQLIGEVIQIALSFVGSIFLVLTVYAGFLWMNARGEDSQIQKAQGILRTAVVGIIITVGAYSITSFIVPRIVDRTTGTGSGGSGAIGCCFLEQPDEFIAGAQIVNGIADCEAAFGGCIDRFAGQYADCEFQEVATRAQCSQPAR